MGRTGEAVKRIAPGGYRPTWSPDGKQIAYAFENVDVNPQNGRGEGPLRLVDVDTGEAHDTGVQDAVQPTWSPHGRRIAYVKNLSNAQQRDIWTMSVAGGTETAAITHPSADWSPMWSPDGRYLYFTSDRGGSTNLWRIAIDEASGAVTGDAEPLTTPAAFAAHPAISADGRHIAYSAVSITTNVQALTLNPATQAVRGEPVWITTGSRVWSGPDPSPTGDAVVFYSRYDPEGHLYIVRGDGTGLRQLTADRFIDRMPRWSPDGRSIAFFSNRDGDYELWTIRPDGSELRQLSRAGGGFVAWSPDGSKIATYRAPRPARKQEGGAYIFEVSGPGPNQPQMLPPLQPPSDQYVVNSWSPDGTRLAGQVGYAGKGIVVYSIRDRSYDRLVDFGEYPVWVADSRLLFSDGGKSFWTFDLAARQARRIYSGGRDVLGAPRLTRDGRTAFFSRRTTQADIWIVNLQ